jgi:transcriptional regulator
MPTRRQRIVELLEAEGAYGFDELREVLGVPVHVLETDLKHVEKSVRAAGRTLTVEPPRCLDCGFLFRGRGQRHFYAPSRCPECRSESISQPLLSIA